MDTFYEVIKDNHLSHLCPKQMKNKTDYKQLPGNTGLNYPKLIRKNAYNWVKKNIFTTEASNPYLKHFSFSKISNTSFQIWKQFVHFKDMKAVLNRNWRLELKGVAILFCSHSMQCLTLVSFSFHFTSVLHLTNNEEVRKINKTYF